MLTILIRGYRVSDSGVQIVIELAEKKTLGPSAHHVFISKDYSFIF